PVLGIAQTIRLAACVHDALATGEDRNGAIAARALAKVALTVPSRGCGPRKKGKSGRVPLKRQTAAHLLKEMRGAWRAVLDGCASAYQFHVVSLSLLSEQGYDPVPDWGAVFGLRRLYIRAD